VDVTQRGKFGATAILLVAELNHATTVKYLQAAGASITEKNDNGFSALHLAAHRGRLALLQYFLMQYGGRISDTTDEGETLWQLLRLQVAETVALASLLKVMVMLDDTPPEFVARLSRANAELTTRGRQYRALPLTSCAPANRRRICREYPGGHVDVWAPRRDDHERWQEVILLRRSFRLHQMRT
jgi:hypothetical protein